MGIMSQDCREDSSKYASALCRQTVHGICCEYMLLFQCRIPSCFSCFVFGCIDQKRSDFSLFYFLKGEWAGPCEKERPEKRNWCPDHSMLS